jgi:hypothetical protein
MSKEEVLAEFDRDITNQGYKPDGNIIYRIIFQHAAQLILTDRLGVIDALRYWLLLRDDPFTVFAINLIQDLVIKELKPDLEKLRNDIESRNTLLPYYNEWVDRALKAIS